MNHKLVPIVVFMTLMLTSLLAGRYNYRVARDKITADLNQALVLTIKEKEDLIITRDTIRAYKQLRQSSGGQVLIAISDKRFCHHLKDERLKETSFLTFDIMDKEYRSNGIDEQVICSDTLVINDQCAGETLALKGYTRLSTAAVFSMSDQRLPITCMVMAFFWATISWLYQRRKEQDALLLPEFGGLSYSESDGRFYDATRQPIHFTPMQQQLMTLFWNAPSHSLPKEEICATLWPKKEDANDTLYTLVRRLKPIVEEHTNLMIVADRGKNYSLKPKPVDN